MRNVFENYVSDQHFEQKHVLSVNAVLLTACCDFERQAFECSKWISVAADRSLVLPAG